MLSKLNTPDKVFLSSAAIMIAVLSYLSYRTINVLESTDSVDSVMYDYHTLDSILAFATPCFFAVLLVLSNIADLKRARGIFFLAAFLIFAVFTVIDYAYIAEEFFHFRKRSGMWKGEFSVTFLIGSFWCLIAGSVTLINYLALFTYKKYFKK